MTISTKNGDIEYWATSDLSIDELFRLKYAKLLWAIEDYHPGIKQIVQRNHIGLALRAFLSIERLCCSTGISWIEAKASII